MVLRGCLIAGFVFVWASVIVIPLGTHLLTQSPLFQEYEGQVMDAIIPANSGNPTMFFLAFYWPFLGCCYVFIGLLFTGGVLIVCNLVSWRRDVGLLAAGAFGIGCLAGAFLGIRDAVEHFRWGFAVLGFGDLLFAAGLGFGAIGAVGNCLTKKYLRT